MIILQIAVSHVQKINPYLNTDIATHVQISHQNITNKRNNANLATPISHTWIRKPTNVSYATQNKLHFTNTTQIVANNVLFINQNTIHRQNRVPGVKNKNHFGTKLIKNVKSVLQRNLYIIYFKINVLRNKRRRLLSKEMLWLRLTDKIIIMKYM
jgi:hypothetical protein